MSVCHVDMYGTCKFALCLTDPRDVRTYMVPRKTASMVEPCVMDCPMGHFHPFASLMKYSFWSLRVWGIGERKASIRFDLIDESERDMGEHRAQDSPILTSSRQPAGAGAGRRSFGPPRGRWPPET